MPTRTTRQRKDTVEQPTLYIAFELGHKTWHLRFGDRQRFRDIEVPARDLDRLHKEVEKSRAKFGLDPKCRILSCYEAGWDGFWLARYLDSRGIENLVVDSSSIEVNRRRRRAKTDGLDVAKLLELLRRHDRGERVWSVVVVPSVQDEDARQPHRELGRLKRERRRHRNRLQGLLVTQGITEKLSPRTFSEQLESFRCQDGKPVPDRLKQALQREWARLKLVMEQIAEIEAMRRVQAANPVTLTEQKVADLIRLKAIGENASWILATEFFGWRRFDNGKQVGSLAGLTPTPYSSGLQEREQGISKSGNREVRRLMVQIAWLWLRYQRRSALSRWYRKRFGEGGTRLRRIGLVALARKLLVALWQWVEYGVIPDGATVAKIARP
jgi:transposase